MTSPIASRLFLCIAFAYIAHSSLGQSYNALVSKADSLYEARDYKGSVKYYTQAFEVRSTVPGHLYNGACSAALSGGDQLALQWLKLAIESGWTNIKHLKNDSDLTSLHALPQWTVLLEDLQKKVDVIESKYDKKLQEELLTIYESDQGVRQVYMALKPDDPKRKSKADSLGRIMQRTDSVNLIKVSKILDERGWVGSDLVGSQASGALFLVIQHSDLDTQVKYLPMLKDAVRRNVASGEQLALLEDRIAIRQGRQQVYGSQVGMNDKTGKYYVLPLEDPHHVDARRASMGLGPISEYVKRWGIQWDPVEQEKIK